MSVMEPQHGNKQGRPRARSGFSFTSNHSERSKKSDLQETHEEKKRTHLSNNTKANPNAAMTEAQPGE
jgi:hypothetical protein